jgi:hypothetical protein
MQFACNAHTICDPELRPLGTGLYPVISIINHRSYAKLLAIYSFIYYLYQIRAINISPPSLFIHFFWVYSVVYQMQF